MKNIYTTSLLTLVLVVGISMSAPRAQAAANDAQIAQLQNLVQQLTTLLNKLIAERAAQTTTTVYIKPNLVVHQVSVERETISGNSMGAPLPDQELQITVKNDSQQSVNSTNQLFEYEVYVYEELAGTDEKTSIFAAGEILIPVGGQTTTFSVNVQGGLSFNGDYERIFYPKIVIDPDNAVKEINERDNSMKATGTTWETDYYKG